MIKKETLTFLRELRDNNLKEWFAANHERYTNYKADILQFIERLMERVSGFDHTILEAGLNLKKCQTRINRDLRFSKDKTPYKT